MLFSIRKRQTDLLLKENIQNLKTELSSVKFEMDDHFQAINDNTAEIDTQNSFICEIDNRINKIEEKMDALHILLKQLVSKSQLSIELTKDEQRVFLQLYTTDKFLCFEEIAKKTFLDSSSVKETLTAMLDKGIPFVREILNDKIFFKISDDFKLKQAKEQIIKIDVDVTKQFQNTLLEQFFN